MNNNRNIDDAAIQTLAQQIVQAINSSESGCDKTYKSVITHVNPDGSYQVLDNYGTNRNARCVIPNVALSTNQNVWIKEPCGNINNIQITGAYSGTLSEGGGETPGSGYYTKSEINNNYYNKTDINNKLSNLIKVATKEEIIAMMQ